MIHYRRRPLPPPLRAIAWRAPYGEHDGREVLMVVVDDNLDVKSAKTAAADAVRRLKRSGRIGAASVVALAGLTAVALAIRAATPPPGVVQPYRRRPEAAQLHAARGSAEPRSPAKPLLCACRRPGSLSSARQAVNSRPCDTPLRCGKTAV